MGSADEKHNPATPEEIREAHRVAERIARVRRDDLGNGIDARPRVTLNVWETWEDELLKALIREHPERDPARLK